MNARRITQWVLIVFIATRFMAPWASAVGPVIGANCLFSWNAPIKNADGTPLTDLNGYRLYLAHTSGGYTEAAADIDHPHTEIDCEDADITTDGQYYAVVTAVDTTGNESPRSAEIAFVRNTTAPAAPILLTIVVQQGDSQILGSGTITIEYGEERQQGTITITPAP